MHTVSFLIIITFIFSTTALPINCPSSSAEWCQTKEIAAVCGVCATYAIFLLMNLFLSGN